MAIGTESGRAGYPFFAMLSRMRHINRWGLMRNTRSENIQEHSLMVAMTAHALALIRNRYFNGNVNPDRVAVIAMYHDCDEILTGDLPTPVKYFNEGILNAYREVESAAKTRLLSMLPEDIRGDYGEIIFFGNDAGDSVIWRLVKAADTICAYIKCLEELAGGNSEFATAAKSTKSKLDSIDLPEVGRFMSDYIDSFNLTLDDYGI